MIEEVLEGRLVDAILHPNQEKYPGQQFLIVRLDGYIHAVPYVIEGDGSYFLKTIFPHRKLNKRYSH